MGIELKQWTNTKNTTLKIDRKATIFGKRVNHLQTSAIQAESLPGMRPRDVRAFCVYASYSVSVAREMKTMTYLAMKIAWTLVPTRRKIHKICDAQSFLVRALALQIQLLPYTGHRLH